MSSFSPYNSIGIGIGATIPTSSYLNLYNEFVVQEGSKVGIGTTTPSARFVVNDIVNDTTDIAFFNCGSNSTGLRIDHANNTVNRNAFTVNTGVGNVAVIRCDGNVGIGTTNPGSKLHLSGFPNVNAPISLTLQPGETNDMGGLTQITAVHTGPFGKGTAMTFSTRTDSGSDFDPTSLVTEKMRIDASGNVGVGSTNPNYKLDVVGDVNITGNFLVNGVANPISTPWLTSGLDIYYNTGNVGIGTATPGARFVVNDIVNSATDIAFFNCGSNSTGIRIDHGNNSLNRNALTVNTGAGNVFNVRCDGNVGIGTNNPGSKLDVIGDVRAANFIVTSDERIKSNISEVDRKLALERVRLIKPSEFNFIENSKRGSTSSKVIGFIAQDVRQYVPEAVTLGTRFIPDVFSNCTIHPEDFRMVVPGRARSGKIRIMLTNSDGETNLERVMDLSVLRLDSDTLQYDTLSLTEEDRAILSRRDQIFVYGYEVDDFHSLNKDYLFALNFAATREIDEKVQRLERENQALKDSLEKILYTMKEHGMEIQ